MVNRLRQILSEMSLPTAPSAELNVSCGVALFGENGTTSEQLIASADEAMYADKRMRKALARMV